MKTFEERYTAWIDGQLEGPALSAFERELTRRAAEGEAAADKADTVRLRGLLQDHFQAPTLTNPDFFNHQLRERIDAEGAVSSGGRDSHRGAEPAIFAWGLARLVGLGALSVFAAAAIYYGMMPPHGGAVPNLASVNGHPGSNGATIADVPVPMPAAPADAPTDAPSGGGAIQLVQLAPTPVPIDLSTDIKAHVPDQATNPTTVTPLHYNKPNVNVLWLNGLEYLPSVSEDAVTPAAADSPAASSPVAAPSASASP